MADISKWSTSVVQHFTYANRYPQALTAAQSVSCYVYDPSNVMVYSDSKPLPGINPETGVAWGVGVLEFHVPPTTFLQTTKPEGYYNVVTIAQLPDGSVSGNAEIVSVV